MSLKAIVASGLILLALNGCSNKIDYIQPKLPILTEYNIKVLEDVSYISTKDEGKTKYVIAPKDFDRIVNWVKKADDANVILNRQIRKYNKYAKGENDGINK